jgi:hypothetical protein
MTPVQAKNVVVNIICLGGCLAAAAFGIFSWVSNSKSSVADYKYPSTVTQHEDAADGGAGNFTLKIQVGSNLFSMSSDIASIAQHEMTAKPAEESIVFHVVADIDNLYGNRVQVDAFDLTFSMDDLKQVNWSNIDGPRLLNLGKIDNETGNGATFIADYCAENQKSSQFFCDAGTHWP